MKVNRFLPMTGAAILAVFSLTLNSHAQTAGRGDAAQMAQLDQQLAHVDRLINNSETAKSVGEFENQGKEISESLEKYAKSMLETANKALMDAEKAARSEGKEGSTASVAPVEDLMKRHENKMKQLNAKAQRISEKFEKLERDPKSDSKKTSSLMTPASEIASRAWLVTKNIVESAIPSANAAILIPIVAACKDANPNKNPPPTQAQYKACAAAIALGHTQRLAAQSTFTACWGAAHRHKLKDGHIHFPALMHTACTAVLVARLA